MADERTPVLCQECNDGPAVTRRRFNGAALYDLCQGCADFWDEHDLADEHLIEVVPGRDAVNLVCGCGWHEQFITTDGPVFVGTLTRAATDHEEVS